MTSFKKTTYSFLLLFFVSCFFSLYAEAQRAKGKRARKTIQSFVQILCKRIRYSLIR